MFSDSKASERWLTNIKSKNKLRKKRCIVTRKLYSTEMLIRFVLSPEKTIVPDPWERLPGRGLWLEARRDIVETACDIKAFDRVMKQEVSVSSALADMVEQLLLRRCIELIGLARRAGNAVAGFEKTRTSIVNGKAVLAIVAIDGAKGSKKKLLSGRLNFPVIDVFLRRELGCVFDRDNVVFVALSNLGLAMKLQIETYKLAGFRTTFPAVE
tara:strand:+ start:16992 stop:17627 length:636 start_codon:yes stop_codon:yes gene_type:complete